MTNQKKNAAIAGGIVGLALLASGGLWAEQNLSKQPQDPPAALQQPAQEPQTQAKPVLACDCNAVHTPVKAKPRKVVARAKRRSPTPVPVDYAPAFYPPPVAIAQPPLPVHSQPVIVASPSIVVGGLPYGYGYSYAGYPVVRGGRYSRRF